MPDPPEPVPAVALLLCAGASRRWGDSGPKALASVDGRPVLEMLAQSARAAGCVEVRAVLGSESVRIREVGLVGLDLLVENRQWELGQTSSIRAGLASLDRPCFAVIWPVDTPFVRSATVERLLAAARREAGIAVWFTPTFEGRGGHPVVLSPEGVELAQRWKEDAPFRDAPFRKGPGEFRLAVDDPGIRDNTNYPDDFAAAERAWRARGGRTWTGP